LLSRLPDDIGVAGDLAYLNLAKLREKGFAPRRKPCGQDRPPDDVLEQELNNTSICLI